MSVPYYIGAKAIAERLGYRSTRMVMKLVERDNLPVYKRVKKTRTGACTCLAISESAITAWEITKGQQFVNQTKAKRRAKQEAKGYALAG